MKRSAKTLLKTFFPPFFVQIYHQIRVFLFDFKRRIFAIIYSGVFFECPFCGKNFRRFMPDGLAIPVLEKHQVVGAGKRENALCPNCLSKDRERLLYVFLNEKTNVFEQKSKILHIAPEKQLKAKLQAFHKENYTDGDMQKGAASLVLDLTKLPFDDSSFDVVLCNHVLEHIPDDNRALSEIRRVLKPDGFAILQVPIALLLDKTIENTTLTNEDERERLFGQKDHVRIYGLDYAERIASANLLVSVIYPQEIFASEIIQKYALIKQENVFLCKRK